MTEKEWLESAEYYEDMAQKAFDDGDEIAAELWERKAESCRYAACNAPVESGGV